MNLRHDGYQNYLNFLSFFNILRLHNSEYVKVTSKKSEGIATVEIRPPAHRLQHKI